MLLAERKGGKLIPSHELVSRFGRFFTAGRLIISAQDGERWLMGHELRRRNIPTGVVLVQDEQGRLLGRGKVVGERIRNLLPRRLVY
jgi:NOL1/NOP2/fmu family ribosome biogenesis protein